MIFLIMKWTLTPVKIIKTIYVCLIILTILILFLTLFIEQSDPGTSNTTLCKPLSQLMDMLQTCATQFPTVAFDDTSLNIMPFDVLESSHEALHQMENSKGVLDIDAFIVARDALASLQLTAVRASQMEIVVCLLHTSGILAQWFMWRNMRSQIPKAVAQYCLHAGHEQDTLLYPIIKHLDTVTINKGNSTLAFTDVFPTSNITAVATYLQITKVRYSVGLERQNVLTQMTGSTIAQWTGLQVQAAARSEWDITWDARGVIINTILSSGYGFLLLFPPIQSLIADPTIPFTRDQWDYGAIADDIKNFVECGRHVRVVQYLEQLFTFQFKYFTNMDIAFPPSTPFHILHSIEIQSSQSTVQTPTANTHSLNIDPSTISSSPVVVAAGDIIVKFLTDIAPITNWPDGTDFPVSADKVDVNFVRQFASFYCMHTHKTF